jgi:hypothetical protein
MSKLIAQIKQRIAAENRQAEMACNYANNYYGDQLCKTSPTND